MLQPPQSSPLEEEPEQPPSLTLSAPPKGDPESSPWKIEGHSKKVVKAWNRLVQDTPANATNCFDWLMRHPNKRMPGRCFPLKYKKYEGVWQYEIGAGDRINYTLDEATKTVTVYYAGPHLSKTPTPS